MNVLKKKATEEAKDESKGKENKRAKPFTG